MQFKDIDIKWVLYQRVRSYFAINKAQGLSVMYKFLFCILYPLQSILDKYNINRIKNSIIANCAWQYRQAQNVLNYLYDTGLNRIIIQSTQELNKWWDTNEKDSNDFLVTNEKESVVFLDCNSKNTIISRELKIFIPSDIYDIAPMRNQIDTTVKYLIFEGQKYNLVRYE